MAALVADLPPGHPDEFVGQSLTPAEQIRILLERKKQQGITDWERVWPWAFSRVRWPHDHTERHEYRSVIEWSEPYFRAAFEGTGSDMNVAKLLACVNALARFAEDPGNPHRDLTVS